jgi:hypothetical protein
MSRFHGMNPCFRLQWNISTVRRLGLNFAVAPARPPARLPALWKLCFVTYRKSKNPSGSYTAPIHKAMENKQTRRLPMGHFRSSYDRRFRYVVEAGEQVKKLESARRYQPPLGVLRVRKVGGRVPNSVTIRLGSDRCQTKGIGE